MNIKTPIAIVGLSGVFPGASNLNTYWENIVNGVSSICDVPANRWVVNPDSVISSTVTQDKVLSKKAGLINNFTFNPKNLNIDANLLNKLDPMFHILLTAGKDALSDCVVNNDTKKRTGVILAAIALPTDASSAFTRQVLGKSLENSIFGVTSTNDNSTISKESVLASRVTSLPASILAKSLNLGGGSYTLDAACSSSLYSIKLACDELRTRRCDMMLAGGVSRPESLFTQTGFSQLTALSPTGICAPFDQSADGLVVGEGAGIIVLKRLDDAIRDGDTIHGLLHGAGLTNDIGGNLLAPDTEGQVRAMKLAYKNSGWSPFDIDHIECHGTGTPVGDKIELKSLKTVWGDSGWDNNQCAIGSVKSMIGHLLTAAGIAGTIKTILALKNKTIPPSLNFTKPSAGSPLENGPFYVPTKPKEWEKKSDAPRRAAMSAFGFGGINAHVLMEEWDDKNSKSFFINASVEDEKKCAVAITGMGTFLNSASTLKEFQKVVLNGEILTKSKALNKKWRDCEEVALNLSDMKDLPQGNYIENFNISIGEVHIPPMEIPDILPQHLLMLKAASMAIEDSNIKKRSEKPRMGAAIGMNFDFEATNFNLRWNLENDVEKWDKLHSLNLNTSEKEKWTNELRASHMPPLSPSRTTGALGGIIASRIAKEFKLGGPSFIVSSEDTSGIKALEIGIQSIQNNETDVFLAGAVDLPGEIRNIVAAHTLRPFSDNNIVSPFDKNANGPLPGEGAVAIVLKRLDKAIEDGDRIYSVIRGTGNASSGGIDEDISENAYTASMTQAFRNADISPESISYIETHGSSDPWEDKLETSAINKYFNNVYDRDSQQSMNVSPPRSNNLTDLHINNLKNKKHSIAIGSITPTTGHTGAAAGLTSLIKASLCLYQEILPPLVNFKSPAGTGFNENYFHIPVFPQYWMRDRIKGPRAACVASMSTEGNCSHVLLEAFEEKSTDINSKATIEKKAPLGNKSYGLFAIEANSKKDLLVKLNNFQEFVTLKSNNFEKSDINKLAQQWYDGNKPDFSNKLCISLVANRLSRLNSWINEAINVVNNDTKISFNGPDGIYYSPSPLGRDSEIGFVYPGSGNHYIGMGKGIGTYWPEILRELDNNTEKLKSQLLPDYFLPHKVSWENDWEISALQKANNTPQATITGQVSHGVLQTAFLKSLDISPASIISYSLGESAGYFATQTWTERDIMLSRMEESNLFTEQLAGLCSSARQEWKISDDVNFNWQVAFVNKSKTEVEKALKGLNFAKLLIVNTPDECVVGGLDSDIKALIQKLNCTPIFINGVVTVHCDAAKPAAEEYRNLHLLKTTPPENLKFYSCYSGKAYEVTEKSAADSVLNQALYGFDFPKIINNAYNDGTRIFIEAGPGSSCCRMIEKILIDKPFLCVSSCVKGEDDYLTTLKLAGSLTGERVPVNPERLYDREKTHQCTINDPSSNNNNELTIVVGGRPPTLPDSPLKEHIQNIPIDKVNGNSVQNNSIPIENKEPLPTATYKKNTPEISKNSPVKTMAESIKTFTENNIKTSDAHNKFIDFSNNLSKSFARTINIQTDLIEKALRSGDKKMLSELYIKDRFKNNLETTKKFNVSSEKKETIIKKTEQQYETPANILSPHPVEKILRPEPAFPRNMCMEFAIGSLEKVLGPQFAEVDTYDVRVRLPDEPLMLVDRILSVEGEIGSLKSGKVVTEHDVLPDAWYLDGGRAPVCISIEAGQADLFLCSYLGIDLEVKGKRSYRLLDAVAQFHGGLPKPGDTIRYEIEIERFINQGETYLFFFNFNGFLGNKHIISMRNGCAGFFTQKEVKDSGGIVLTNEETAPVPGVKTPLWSDLVDFFDSNNIYKFDDDKINALREGDAEKAFGPLFKGKNISKSLAIPGGRMKLVDRVLSIDPQGGRYGLGQIRAQADIYPDSWFLTCHFVDDMVMPGTLMYECCMHTLRIFTMRMGWISDKEDVCCEPVPEVESFLKCRGPVTVETKHVYYVIDIKEIGYNPEPFVIADAHMYAHDEHIVMFKDMSMKISGITKTEIEHSWE